MRNNIAAQHFLTLINSLRHNEYMRGNCALVLSQLADYGLFLIYLWGISADLLQVTLPLEWLRRMSLMHSLRCAAIRMEMFDFGVLWYLAGSQIMVRSSLLCILQQLTHRRYCTR